MKILIIGLGSIGEKHLDALNALKDKHNLSIFIFKPTDYGPSYFIDLKKQLKDLAIDAAFICNPTSLHIKTTLICLEAGVHIFLEKPISHKYDRKNFSFISKMLKKKNLTLMVGYDMRFNPWIRAVKRLIDKKAIGDIWGARVMAGQHLSTWRKGVDYRKNYGAKKKMGGGVLLDASHELDYLYWLLPKKLKSITAKKIHTGRLEIETEDICSLILEYSDRSTAHVQLDYLNVPYRRSLEFYGDEGTILWDDNKHEIDVYAKSSKKWEKVLIPEEQANGKIILYNELSHFFNCIKNKREPLNTFDNSIYIMKLIQKAGESSIKNKTVIF